MNDFLSDKTIIEYNEIDDYKESYTIYKSAKNKLYALNKNETEELILKLKNLENIKDNLNKKDFGLNDFKNYDLALYIEFLNEFKLNN